MNYSNFITKSREWLETYIKNNHLQSVVIGISGGIDSTCSAVIASEVCTKLNIPLIGRSLPTSTNKTEEVDVANLVGEAFCTNFKEVQINCDDIIHEFELCEGEMTLLQKGNIKARYRMMYLRNLASLYNGIVLDNDNFTEWNLGFWTIGGDSPGDVNLGLHYLWKTEIYELAKYLLTELETLNNPKQSYEIQALKASINLTPTDGNGVSKSDVDQFGLENYKQVDDVLKTMYYSDKKIGSPEHLDEYIRLIDSYNEQGVDKVMLLHQNTKYKRQSQPITPDKNYLDL